MYSLIKTCPVEVSVAGKAFTLHCGLSLPSLLCSHCSIVEYYIGNIFILYWWNLSLLKDPFAFTASKNYCMQEKWLFWYQVYETWIFTIATKLRQKLQIFGSHNVSFLSKPWEQVQSCFLILKKRHSSTIEICVVNSWVFEKKKPNNKTQTNLKRNTVKVVSYRYW